MIPDLPSSLLRSFVAVVDCGTLVAASARVGRSESALSLQMSRLEDIVGQPLFDRDGRALKLNRTGGLLLSHARGILGRIDAARTDLGRSSTPPARIGIVQDFADSVLRPTLADIRAAHPGTPISMLVGNSAELLKAMGEAQIDVAICAGEPIGGSVAARLPMQWFGEVDLLSKDVLPLIGITPPCPFLKAAQQALDSAGQPWHLALVTPSLEGLRAAVRAGLGITCRTELGLGVPPLPDRALPPLPEIPYSVIERHRDKDGPGLVARHLAKHLAALPGLS